MENKEARLRGTVAQGWIGLAVWMSAGLLLEGLLAFRSPAYLQDPVRRELFRLAHAHGTLLSLILLVYGIYLDRLLIAPPRAATIALRLGVVLMPTGLFLGGVWHYESDPGLLVFLAPLGGILVLFAIIAAAVSSLRK